MEKEALLLKEIPDNNANGNDEYDEQEMEELKWKEYCKQEELKMKGKALNEIESTFPETFEGNLSSCFYLSIYPSLR